MTTHHRFYRPELIISKTKVQQTGSLKNRLPSHPYLTNYKYAINQNIHWILFFAFFCVVWRILMQDEKKPFNNTYHMRNFFR